MSTDWSVLADQITFHFQEVTTPISAHAYTKPVSEQSKHPRMAHQQRDLKEALASGELS